MVSCTDFNDYLCKYATGKPADPLMWEYLAARLAQVAGLQLPSPALVKILAGHLPARTSALLSGFDFSAPCFGLRYVSSGKEMDGPSALFFKNARERHKIRDKSDLLRIALFDLWVANEDRHAANYNLLFSRSGGHYHWHPIDHGMVFNSGAAPRHGLVELSFNETLFDSPLLKTVYTHVRDLKKYSQKLPSEIGRWISEGRKEYGAWLKEAPSEWQIDPSRWAAFLELQLFDNEWKGRVLKQFSHFCTLLLR